MNFLKAAYSVLLRTERASNNPIHLQIEPTTSCNLRCKFCNREKIIKKPRQLEFEQFKEIFDQIKPSRTTLSGRGEPLLASDLCKMIAYAKRNGSKTIITTNFTLGEKYVEKLVDSGIDDIRISLDAAKPETYDNIRGADLQYAILQGIDEINKLKQKKQKIHPALGFEFVIIKDNIDECLEILHLAKKYGVIRVNYRVLNSTGVEEKEEDLLLVGESKDEFLELLYDIKKAEGATGVKTNADELIRDFSFVWSIYQGRVNGMPDCLFPWLQVYVNVDGEIAPCCALNTDEEISMGNVFQNGFREVWNSGKYMNLRRITKERKLPFNSCKHCPSKGLKWMLGKYNFLKLQ